MSESLIAVDKPQQISHGRERVWDSRLDFCLRAGVTGCFGNHKEDIMTLFKRIGAWITATLVALLLTVPAHAAPPKDTFVMAKDISDLITLDPAEVFELSGGEVIANIYDRLMMYEPEDLTTLVGGVAESWEVTDGGKSIIFSIRPGQTFHSGNPVTAEDVAFSLQRVVKLGKTPAFIVTQFGWTPENVDELVVVEGEKVKITIVEEFSPALVLNALSAGIASIVDMKTVMEKRGRWRSGICVAEVELGRFRRVQPAHLEGKRTCHAGSQS